MFWLARWRAGGITKLREQSGRGRRPLIPEEDYPLLREGLAELHNQRTGGRIRGKDVVEWIEQRYGTRPSLNNVYHILNKAGISWITSRSIHPKANIEQQEEFKKIQRCSQ